MKHSVDITALAGYVAGGGLAGVAGFLAILLPKYSGTITAGAVALVALAGFVRVLGSPTPTNTVQVFDRNSGSTVEMKTVEAPSAVPASAPTYTKTQGTP